MTPTNPSTSDLANPDGYEEQHGYLGMVHALKIGSTSNSSFVHYSTSGNIQTRPTAIVEDMYVAALSTGDYNAVVANMPKRGQYQGRIRTGCGVAARMEK